MDVKKQLSYKCSWPDCNFDFPEKSLLERHVKNHSGLVKLLMKCERDQCRPTCGPNLPRVMLTSSDLIRSRAEIEELFQFWVQRRRLSAASGQDACTKPKIILTSLSIWRLALKRNP